MKELNLCIEILNLRADCFFYEIEIVHKLSLLLIVMLSTNAVITFVILIQPTLIIRERILLLRIFLTDLNKTVRDIQRLQALLFAHNKCDNYERIMCVTKSHHRDYCNMDMSDSSKGLLSSIRNYPPGVFFMLGNEFCERFSFYGMRAVLILYLITEHHFTERYTISFMFYHFMPFLNI
ncbi:unnamed protein product [Brugia timori]|uniref:G protein-coupled receptor n=1 Tax=Brugia timori TaxID=42155 RepID=A0A0R3QM60_9BILA|nr:unnamed protein product [Brugia timori]